MSEKATSAALPAASAPREAAPTSESNESGDSGLDAFLPAPFVRAQTPLAAAPAGLCSARIVEMGAAGIRVRLTRDPEPREAFAAEDLDLEVLEEALAAGERVLVEPDADDNLIVVGVIRTRKPEVLKLSASRIEIEAEQEIVLRSGVAAVRLREDGDVEVLGSRISAASRGLFRLVGRMLRLN